MAKQKFRLMIVGADGSLGGEIRDIVGSETNWTLIEVTRNEARSVYGVLDFDSNSKNAWRALLEREEWRPDIIVNAAAMTNVEACEANRTEAWRNNVTLVEILVGECKRHNIKLIHISSDYIFDGTGGPYIEGGTPHPINYYGKTKLAAENACVGGEINYAIVRTMWLYGEQQKGKTSFVSWLVDTLSAEKEARVVTDEFGNPTFQQDVAYGIIKIVERDARGIFNIAGPELISRWEFATIVAETYELDPMLLVPITSNELQRIAKRPLKSGLISLRAQTVLGLRLTPVRNGLEICKIMEHRTTR